MTLSRQIQKALDLPDGAVYQRDVPLSGRALITVIDPGFEEMREIERIRKVRRTLEAAGIDLRRIGHIMTNTPEEEQGLLETIEL